ncbi:MAG TPA: hypothetical protein DGR15_08785 [Methylophilus sp.]|nr:hypothetical protein [Methylophilus sp.]
MPIERCTASAAGGTSQRLKWLPAVMCSLERLSKIKNPFIFCRYILLQFGLKGNNSKIKFM